MLTTIAFNLKTSQIQFQNGNQETLAQTFEFAGKAVSQLDSNLDKANFMEVYAALRECKQTLRELEQDSKLEERTIKKSLKSIKKIKAEIRYIEHKQYPNLRNKVSSKLYQVGNYLLQNYYEPRFKDYVLRHIDQSIEPRMGSHSGVCEGMALRALYKMYDLCIQQGISETDALVELITEDTQKLFHEASQWQGFSSNDKSVKKDSFQDSKVQSFGITHHIFKKNLIQNLKSQHTFLDFISKLPNKQMLQFYIIHLNPPKKSQGSGHAVSFWINAPGAVRYMDANIGFKTYSNIDIFCKELKGSLKLYKSLGLSTLSLYTTPHSTFKLLPDVRALTELDGSLMYLLNVKDATGDYQQMIPDKIVQYAKQQIKGLEQTEHMYFQPIIQACLDILDQLKPMEYASENMVSIYTQINTSLFLNLLLIQKYIFTILTCNTIYDQEDPIWQEPMFCRPLELVYESIESVKVIIDVKVSEDILSSLINQVESLQSACKHLSGEVSLKKQSIEDLKQPLMCINQLLTELNEIANKKTAQPTDQTPKVMNDALSSIQEYMQLLEISIYRSALPETPPQDRINVQYNQVNWLHKINSECHTIIMETMRQKVNCMKHQSQSELIRKILDLMPQLSNKHTYVQDILDQNRNLKDFIIDIETL